MTDTIPQLIEKVLKHKALDIRTRNGLVRGLNVNVLMGEVVDADVWDTHAPTFCLRCMKWLLETKGSDPHVGMAFYCHPQIGDCDSPGDWCIYFRHDTRDTHGPTQEHAILHAMLAALDEMGGE